MPTLGEAAVGRRLALVLATGSYSDPALAKLWAPGQDASDLANVLKDAAVGGFEVETVLDAPADSLRRGVAQFCARIRPSDLVLVYLSCHGLLDDRGRLYYATIDTDRTLLSATAVSSAWLNEQLEDCRCRRQILVLDCCHSGAFAKGAKGDPPTESVISNVKVGTGITDDDIAVAAGAVIVWDPDEGWLTRIDARAMQVVGAQHIHGYQTRQSINRESSDLAVDGRLAWVTDPTGNTLYKVKD